MVRNVYDKAKLFDESGNSNFVDRLITFEVNQTTGEKTVKGIDFQFGMVTLLVKGMQEQQTQIEELKAENQELKNALCEIKPELEICKGKK